MIKTNYHQKLLDIIRELDGRKPKLLIHACCGPCLTYPLDFLRKHFEVTVYYTNSNIYPDREYDRRLNVVKDFITRYNEDNHEKISWIEDEYDPETFDKSLKPFAEEQEGGKRCVICYQKRMKNTALYAKKNGYEYFSTIMTVSPHKNAQIINNLGNAIEKETGIRYLPADFKKDDGFLKAKKMCDKYCLYRQIYCGCRYSLKELLNRQDKKEI